MSNYYSLQNKSKLSYNNKKNHKGFTLIELMVVISIIAVLSVIGVVVFTNVQKSARDATRKSDVDAIAKAYEVKAIGGVYSAITEADFSGGKMPKDPSGNSDYYNVLANDGSGFKVCAALDSNSSRLCNSSGTNCFCKSSSQGSINTNSGYSGTGVGLGLGGGNLSNGSCDSTGGLANGIAAYWKLDEGAWNGSDSVLDYSGNSLSGTATGTSPVAGKFYNAFDNPTAAPSGNNRFLNMGNVLNMPGSSGFSVAAWVKRANTTNNATQTIIVKGDRYISGTVPSPSNASYILLKDGANNFLFQVLSADSMTRVQSAKVAPSDTNWHLVVGTFQPAPGGSVAIYMDNLPAVSTVTTLSTLFNTTNPFRIGTNSSGTEPWHGSIDDVRVYNKALTSQEVLNLYNAGSGCIP